jgi:transcription initiation factor TFIID subunit 2
MFLSPSTCGGARIWTPCIDDLWERCTWELEFIVPSTVVLENERLPVTVVSSGELMEQVSKSRVPMLTVRSLIHMIQPK